MFAGLSHSWDDERAQNPGCHVSASTQPSAARTGTDQADSSRMRAAESDFTNMYSARISAGFPLSVKALGSPAYLLLNPEKTASIIALEMEKATGARL